MTDFTLFRGQCIGVKVGRTGELLRLTLDIEDYNRLFDRSPVGAPDGTFIRQEEDGTYVPYDPYAVNDSSTDAELFIKFMQRYWAGPDDVLDNEHLLTYTYIYRLQQDDDIEWTTALTDLRSVFDEWAARSGAGIRYWVDPDLYAHWQAFVPYEPLYVGMEPDELGAGGFPVLDPNILPAPYAIDNDTPDWTASVMPTTLELSWDWASIVHMVYVKGGTVAPEGSGWVGLAYSGNPSIGYEYVDAPGSVLAADRQAIAEWEINQNHRELLTGSATIPSGYDGWRVGQTVEVSDDVVSGFTNHTVADQPLVIQRVTGRMISPGDGMHMTIDGTDVSDDISEWTSFSWSETLGSADKATAVIEVFGTPATFAMEQLADIRIWTDGAAEIEYDLEFGDIAAGPLPREQKPHSAQPANRFIVTVQDEHIPVGSKSLVTAQLANAAGAPLSIPNVYLEWVLLQWAYEGGGDVQFWLDAVHKMTALVAVYQAIIDEGGTLTAKQQAAMDIDEATLAHDQEMLDAALAGSSTEVAFWTAAVAKMQGYVDTYEAIDPRTAAQEAAYQTDLATLAYDQQQLAAAIAAQGDGPVTPGTGYSLDDVSGITDFTGRAFTYLSHDTAGTTVTLEVDAVALPIS